MWSCYPISFIVPVLYQSIKKIKCTNSEYITGLEIMIFMFKKHFILQDYLVQKFKFYKMMVPLIFS